MAVVQKIIPPIVVAPAVAAIRRRTVLRAPSVAAAVCIPVYEHHGYMRKVPSDIRCIWFKHWVANGC